MTNEESLANARNTIRRTIAARDDSPSLVTQIAVDVGGEIIEDMIPPGHDLNSVELARRYDTSRTPIREALMLLEKEGLVDIPPRRRPRAALHDIQTIRDIYRTRATLLGLISADVATGATEAELTELRNQVDRMETACRAGDIKAYVWANIDFHDLNARTSKNLTAKRIVESLLLRTISLRRWSLSQPGRMEQSLDDHRRLVKSYETHDDQLATALVRANHLAALRQLEWLMATIGEKAQA